MFLEFVVHWPFFEHYFSDHFMKVNCYFVHFLSPIFYLRNHRFDPLKSEMRRRSIKKYLCYTSRDQGFSKTSPKTKRPPPLQLPKRVWAKLEKKLLRSNPTSISSSMRKPLIGHSGRFKKRKRSKNLLSPFKNQDPKNKMSWSFCSKYLDLELLKVPK